MPTAVQLPKDQHYALVVFLCLNDKEDLAQMFLENCSEEQLAKVIADKADWDETERLNRLGQIRSY